MKLASLRKHISPESETSVLKNIPIERFEEVKETVGNVLKVMNHYASVAVIKPRYVFRGPRVGFSHSTRKTEAEKVTVYFDVKPAVGLPMSNEGLNIIKEKAEKLFVEML